MPLRVALHISEECPASPQARLMERLALADRRALGLRFGEPCDPRRLAELCDVEGILETFSDYASHFACRVDEAAARVVNLEAWSSVTMALPTHAYLMLVNPCHAERRRTLSIAHEVGHLVRGHRAVELGRANGSLEHHRYSDAQEGEAYGYGLALLLPYAALVQLVRAGASEDAIAEHYGVSTDAVQMRYKLVGLWQTSRAH